MLSKLEMDYVSSYASRVPYPDEEYVRSALEEIRKCVDLYKSKYSDINYNIYFSNGEDLTLSILERNVAHLLGLQYTNLTNEYSLPIVMKFLGLSKTAKLQSYDLLNRLLDMDSDKIIDFENNGSFKIFNYYRIMIKCGIFEKMTDLSKFNYGCIDFDTNTINRLYGITPSFNSDKLFFVPSGEMLFPYFLMGIKVDDSLGHYIPETLIAPVNSQEFFTEQKVVIPTHLLYDKKGVFNKSEATASEKIALLDMYENLCLKYQIDSCLDYYSDYRLMLHEQARQRVKK